jgi:hypothetical protein
MTTFKTYATSTIQAAFDAHQRHADYKHLALEPGTRPTWPDQYGARLVEALTDRQLEPHDYDELTGLSMADMVPAEHDTAARLEHMRRVAVLHEHVRISCLLGLGLLAADYVDLYLRDGANHQYRDKATAAVQRLLKSPTDPKVRTTAVVRKGLAALGDVVQDVHRITAHHQLIDLGLRPYGTPFTKQHLAKTAPAETALEAAPRGG